MTVHKKLTVTTAMAATLLALPACSEREDWNGDVYAENDTAVCVDQAGMRVDDDLCDDSRLGSSGSYAASGVGNYGGGNGFFWYYLGRRSAIPYYGESINDPRVYAHGSSQPQPGVRYARADAATRMTRSQAVSRGGLGSSGRSFGGGRS